MDTAQTRTVIILSGVLLAVVIVSLTLLWLLPGGTSLSTASPTNEVSSDQTATTTFDTKVLQQSEYIGVDKQMIQDGQLPVQPPAAVGKGNPFL